MNGCPQGDCRTYSDCYATMYAAADGTLLWERYCNLGSENYGTSVAVDGSGNVMVAGFYKSSSVVCPCPDYRENFIAKFAATTGAPVWEQRFNGRFVGFEGRQDLDRLGDDAPVMAVNADGNAVLTLISDNGGCTTKYAASDGALLWEHCQTNGYPKAVAVDANGNVVVTGSSYAGSNWDYHTVKLAAADGALLWKQRYNGSSNGDDLVANSRSLALGSDGSVATTGTSSGDFVTVKYVTISYPTPIMLSLVLTSDGARLRFTGDAGRTYRLQRASDPSGPWVTFASLTAPPDGAAGHLDPAPLSSSPNFYRIAAP
jgi:hypothetical protein